MSSLPKQQADVEEIKGNGLPAILDQISVYAKYSTP